LNTKNSRSRRIRNVEKQARQKTRARKILAEENPGVNAILQIFNKTKYANLVSNVAYATDQKPARRGSAVPNIPFLSYGLFELGMAFELGTAMEAV
jgi:hypothetical protein